MANSRIDTVSSMMVEDFGTTVLITDPRADRYLAQLEKYGKDRYSRWCGGMGGFDGFCERVSE